MATHDERDSGMMPPRRQHGAAMRRGRIHRWSRWSVRVIALMVLVSFPASSVLAISAGELKAMLTQHQRPVIIDIRPRPHYDQAHIPGAISIPAASLAHKALPPFGFVVVCGDGVDDAATRAAAEVLNQDPGIQAVIMEGGFPAWEAEARVTSRGPGLFDEVFEYVSNEDLVRIASADQDMILVDLRPPQAPSTRRSPADDVDLARRFPRHKTVAPAAGRWKKYRENAIGAGELLRLRRLSPSKLYVLIDEGDGATAEAVARSLRGKGIRRVAILAGGDVAMRPEGQPATETRTFPEE
jgi:rhodanese-related sulfurtransferase